MINIKELRLGSYVMYENTTHVVTELCRTPNRIIVGTKWINGDGHYTHYRPELDPIPLTEETLLKCGLIQKGSLFGISFLDTVYWYNLENQILYIEYTDSPFSEYERSRYPISSPIKYLHTLMNAIYSITGKELEYEL